MSQRNDKAKRALEDNVEVVLDKFAKEFLNSEISKVVSDFPVLSTVNGIVAMVYNIRNWRISRNISYFVQGLQTGEAGQEDYNRLVLKYGRNRMLENVLLSLEMMRSEKQAIAFSCLFNALVRGDLDWQRYSELQNILEKIDPSALDEELMGSPSYKFVTVGLAYVQTTYDGTKAVPNGRLFNDYKQYVAEPYRAKIAEAEGSPS
jgi:hypothetical protein